MKFNRVLIWHVNSDSLKRSANRFQMAAGLESVLPVQGYRGRIPQKVSRRSFLLLCMLFHLSFGYHSLHFYIASFPSLKMHTCINFIYFNRHFYSK